MEILPISAKSIRRARQIIKRGGLVIYPTETVYGLGADIFNAAAVKKIFVAKGCNFNKPLSVMVASLVDLKKISLFESRTRNNRERTFARSVHFNFASPRLVRLWRKKEKHLKDTNRQHR